MNIKIDENERIDDLEYKGLKIVQNTTGFCFGIDSVLISDFAKNIKKGANVIDLGTGTGIISVLLCAKTELNKIIGVEVQEEVYNLAQKNISINNLQNRFEVINENIINLKKIYNPCTFDAIVTNPPYKKDNTGIKNIDNKKLISRHEITAKLEDFIEISKYLLKDKGSIYMVHRPERLVDILSLMRKNNLEPKKLRFVCSNVNKEPKLVLIEAVKNAKPFLRIEKNLYVYNEDGKYTDEILEIYNKK